LTGDTERKPDGEMLGGVYGIDSCYRVFAMSSLLSLAADWRGCAAERTD